MKRASGTFNTEVRVAVESLKNASDNFNNTYKALMKGDDGEEFSMYRETDILAKLIE